MSYGSQPDAPLAVEELSLEIRKGEFYTLLGPSGCGKTTTLRCLAGLEEPRTGDILIDDELVFSAARNVVVPPFDRNIGMVFQSYAVWPHMTVFDNVAYPLKHFRPRPSRGRIRDRVREALELVQLSGFADRPAPNLSGGQQQRLALARALVRRPKILLLDEPLSNLDAKLREEMCLELRDLVKRLDVATLYVTHEQMEALSMSDTIAVMNDGRIVQEGRPSEIYSSPHDPFVANFIGKSNLIEGRIVRLDTRDGRDLCIVDTPVGEIVCRRIGALSPGSAVAVVVRAEDVELSAPGDGEQGNVVEGTVESTLFLGDVMECRVSTGAKEIRLKSSPGALAPGDTVRLRFPEERCLALPRA